MELDKVRWYKGTKSRLFLSIWMEYVICRAQKMN